MSRQTEIQELIIKHHRRLQKLKEKKATLGINTPPEILTEIEDIETEVEHLQEELKGPVGAVPIKELVQQNSLSPEDISRVRAYLKGPVSQKEEWDIIKELGEPGLTDVISLLQEIIGKSSGYNSRYLATVALGEIGPAAQTALLEALGHTEPLVRYTALRGLSKLPSSPVIVSRIREILRNDSDSSVQADAVEALGKLNASEAVNDIISALQGSPEVVRMTAAQILGKFDISQVKAALRDTALNDPEYRPRLFAIKSLVELKDVEAISIFATLSTKDSDEHVRKAARDAYFRSKSWTK